MIIHAQFKRLLDNRNEQYLATTTILRRSALQQYVALEYYNGLPSVTVQGLAATWLLAFIVT